MSGFELVGDMLAGFGKPTTFVCPVHGAQPSFAGVDALCPVCENERVLAAHAAEIHERAKAARLEASAIPMRFREVRLEDYRVNHGERQQRALDVCTRFRDNLGGVMERGNSLVMCGSAGTGKTHLACALALAAMDAGYTARYATVVKAMRQVKDTYGRGSEQSVIDAFVLADLLVLDEVGVQFGSDTERNIFFEIINDRYESRRPTIVISNLDKSGMLHFLGERTMSRLLHGGVELIFDWADYRGGAA